MKKKKYTPEYAPGKIIVFFKPIDGYEPDESFAEAIGEHFGYRLDKENDRYEGFVYYVPVGEEENVCKMFKKKDYVENAERYDAKLERRLDLTKELEDMAEDAMCEAENDEEFLNTLRKMKEMIEKELTL